MCSVSTGSERLRGWWNDWHRRQGTECRPRSVLSLFLSKGGQRQFFYLDTLVAVAGGALPPPSGGERCMTSDHIPYSVGNFATPELIGPPWLFDWSQHGGLITAISLSARVCLRAKRWDVNSEQYAEWHWWCDGTKSFQKCWQICCRTSFER